MGDSPLIQYLIPSILSYSCAKLFMSCGYRKVNIFVHVVMAETRLPYTAANTSLLGTSNIKDTSISNQDPPCGPKGVHNTLIIRKSISGIVIHLFLAHHSALHTGTP